MASAHLCAVQAQQHQQHSHRRRRPLDQQHAVTAHPLNDQIAVANSWHVPNRVITATYAGNLDTGKFEPAANQCSGIECSEKIFCVIL